MRKSNLLFILLFCLCLSGCSKDEDSVNVSGAFGTGEISISESLENMTEKNSEDNEDKFAIKDDVTISTEEIESSETETATNNSLSSLQQDKINKIEKDLMSQNTEVTKDDIIELLNTDDFIDLSDSEKESLAIDLVDEINKSFTSETLDSKLVYKHASGYETEEIIIDEEAPDRTYTSEELESMHSEAESLYQQQQISETFEFDD